MYSIYDAVSIYFEHSTITQITGVRKLKGFSSVLCNDTLRQPFRKLSFKRAFYPFNVFPSLNKQRGFPTVEPPVPNDDCTKVEIVLEWKKGVARKRGVITKPPRTGMNRENNYIPKISRVKSSLLRAVTSCRAEKNSKRMRFKR